MPDDLHVPGDERARLILTHLRERRSLPANRMKPDPIPEDQLLAILEAANWAPTHKFTEPWRFRIYREDGRAALAKVLAETYTATAGDAFTPKKLEKIHARLAHVPLAIALIMEPSEKCGLPEYEEILAVGCAAQNLHLAAHALGIGLIWSSPRYLDHPKLRTFLQLEGRMKCFGFLYMGYPVDCWPKSKRGPVEEKIVFVES
ncbi:Putative NAD(P)H nitroreductase [Sulfidibacter corallicola]|uniref:Putative NAD(P)H nitroreductase n=1 Tax=Sulfidibacter corallicola TaxID=2818388 RepID=A0A8A4TVZ1_SULCO|nr:nitroreductase [Sulfidibacter corallicola]QTD53527.1 nitroreductase [Sulfidibacter corallicola]